MACFQVLLGCKKHYGIIGAGDLEVENGMFDLWKCNDYTSNWLNAHNNVDYN